MKPKYRILQINDVFIVQRKILWWWSDITIECNDMSFPLDFSTKEIAEEYIRRLGATFYPSIALVGEYTAVGAKVEN